MKHPWGTELWCNEEVFKGLETKSKAKYKAVRVFGKKG